MALEINLPFDSAPMSESFSKSLERAAVIARSSSDGIVTTLHFLRALCEDPDALTVLVSNRIDAQKLKLELMTSQLHRDFDSQTQTVIDVETSEELDRLLTMAAKAVREFGRQRIDGGVAIVVMVGDHHTEAAQILQRYGLTFEHAVRTLKTGQQLSANETGTGHAVPETSAASDEMTMEDAPGSNSEEPEDDLATEIEDLFEKYSRRDRGTTLDDLTRFPDAPDIGAAAERPRVPGVGGGGAPPRSPGSLTPTGPRGGTGSGGAPPQSPGFGAGSSPDVGAAGERPEVQGVGAAGGSRPTLPGFGASERIGAAPRHYEPLYDILESDPGDFSPDYEAAPEDNTATLVGIGKLVENIPRLMRAFVTETVEVRVARDDSEALRHELAGKGEVQEHDVYVTEAMTVQLRAPYGGFSINSGTPETQWIQNQLGIVDGSDFGAWRWTVTPTTTGRHTLQLVVSARTVNEAGIVAESPLPEQIIEVNVRINYALQFKKIAGWVVAAVSGGVLAKYGENTLDWLLPGF